MLSDESSNQVELNTRAFIGTEAGQKMNVYVEIELEQKDGRSFKIVVTPAMALNMALRIMATAHMTVADAYMLEAMHKLELDPATITKIVNLVRLKRSAGMG